MSGSKETKGTKAVPNGNKNIQFVQVFDSFEWITL
jgi:hypothetical protein